MRGDTFSGGVASPGGAMVLRAVTDAEAAKARLALARAARRAYRSKRARRGAWEMVTAALGISKVTTNQGGK